MHNLGARLADAAHRFADRAAIAASGTAPLRYAQWLSQGQAIREALQSAGLSAGEPVHVRVSNQPLDFAAFLGVWLAGGVIVPQHRSTPQAVVDQALAKTRARFEVDGEKLRLLSGTAPPARSILHGAALVVFTSGSSGMPKGAVLSHRAFSGKLDAIQSLLRFEAEDRTLLVLNTTFSFGIWVALLALLNGGQLVPRERFSAATFLRDLADEQITKVAVVPTMMRSLLLDLPPGELKNEAPSLRHVLIGGETLGKGLGETLRALFTPADLIDIYGLTETATCDFFLMPEDAERYAGCIGRASPGVRYRIVDGENRLVAAGEIGELCISSPYLMSGYLDEPGLEPIRDGWLATGDLARERDAGVVEIAGRKKELIYRGGNKVSPLEVEFACTAHPQVIAALAIGRPDERLGQRIHALVVPREEGLGADELRAFLRGRLERYKVPDVIYFAAELPAGRTGKADRGRFSEMIARGDLKPARGEEP